MIPSVKERQKGAYDFKTFYESVCALNNVVPLQSVTCHLPEGILDIIVDRIRLVAEIYFMTQTHSDCQIGTQ